MERPKGTGGIVDQSEYGRLREIETKIDLLRSQVSALSRKLSQIGYVMESLIASKQPKRKQKDEDGKQFRQAQFGEERQPKFKRFFYGWRDVAAEWNRRYPDEATNDIAMRKAWSLYRTRIKKTSKKTS